MQITNSPEDQTPKSEFHLEDKLEASWKKALAAEFKQVYFQDLNNFILSEKTNKQQTYPPFKDLFKAFTLTPLDKVKVVILGQDPYHGAGQAHGLAFSVPAGVPVPPSLQNIFKELHSDLNCPISKQGDLSLWAAQGVLLLNTVLSVRVGEANSHRDQGWEQFTDAVIQTINKQCEHVVFMLWGAPAITKTGLIDASRHLVLTAPHPSPLSAYRGFMGCKHFSKANAYLKQHKQKPVDWRLVPVIDPWANARF